MTRADDTLARLAARAEIQDVMLRWCRAVDRCDWDAVRRDVFHPDAQDDHGIYKGDLEGMIAWLALRHRSISRSMHQIGNMLIEFAGDDTALVETYATALQRYVPEGAAARAAITGGAAVGDGTFDLLLAGRYIDEFRRRDGTWRILNRTVVFDNSVMFPVPPGGAQLGADWAVSTRDGTDPLWNLRARLGLA